MAEPSNWTNQTNWADQGVFGVTSVLTPNVVNDFRFAMFYWDRINTLPPESQWFAIDPPGNNRGVREQESV